MNSLSRAKPLRYAVLALLVLLLPLRGAAAVKVTEQNLAIPTYLAGEPEPNPMFYFGRASQGAEGRVYPYPLYDTLTNVKSNKTYRIVYLENEYLRVGILPEVGGRLFEAIDKSNGYNFIYRQHVIKPALIGLIGAWISGGIEWNIPHHHRATTFLPVQYRIEEGADGAKTVWVGELELRDRMRWAVGYTLRPGRSYLEASLRIVNRTPFVNTMLCFANVAVHVNDQYQVIYPPHTRFVTFHSKHEFTTWPLATTRYAGADFTRGVDVSWYANHESANSMFAWNYDDDFFAGYDHGRHAGIMSVADHQIVPGKKFWTWGNGPRGRMWDKILTDDDGPYIELMVGGYSDNQPDYSWLQPYETKAFKMYWYPFREIDGVKCANLEAAVNLEFTNGVAKLGFCTTAAQRAAKVCLKASARTLFEETIAINPGKPYVRQVPVPAGIKEEELRASLSVGEKELVGYAPVQLPTATMPEPVKGPPAPKELKTVEELYLAGQRIEQFHNPNLKPEPYWEEALARDPGDARVNTALGIRKLKQARYAEAETHFRKAIDRLSANYTSPKDGEAYYYLGITLQFSAACAEADATNNLDGAVSALSKATWSQAWRSPAYFALAQIAARRGDLPLAQEHVERALEANLLNLGALNLKAGLLRHTGRNREALALLESARRTADPLDVGLMTERWLAGDRKALGELTATLREHPATGLEAAVGYGQAGFWADGVALLTNMACLLPRQAQHVTELAPERGRGCAPLAWYCLADFYEQLGDGSQAADCRRRAELSPPDYVFPFQWELLPVLRRAIAANPRDARAPYYLGNLLFDWQPDEAIKLWQSAVDLDWSNPFAHRNLAIAYAHQEKPGRLADAVTQLEQAVASHPNYAIHFAELDELYARAGAAPEKRLALLEKNHAIVLKRDDALSREIGLKVFAAEYDDAVRLMTDRKFSVWEGGSLDVADHWVNAHLLRGRQELSGHKFAEALADFGSAKTIPENLPNDRGGGGHEAELAYLSGLAQEGLGDAAEAKRSWQKSADASASEGRRGGEARVSERQAQKYFQALARRKLGQTTEAEATLKTLLETATRALEQQGEHSDSGEEQARSRRSSDGTAHYLAGLAHLGLGQVDQAREELKLALAASPDHLGAKAAMAEVGK